MTVALAPSFDCVPAPLAPWAPPTFIEAQKNLRNYLFSQPMLVEEGHDEYILLPRSPESLLYADD